MMRDSRSDAATIRPLWRARRSATAITIGLLLLGASPAAAWDMEWLRQFGGSTSLSAYGGAAGATGVYVVGFIEGDLAGEPGLGNFDAYLRKYAFDGEIAWTERFGTAEFDSGDGVATDDSGVYVVGTTTGAFPGFVNRRADVFVRKYGPGGEILWTTQFGTSDIDFPHQYSGIAVHASGVFLVGSTFGAFPGEAAGVGPDTFVARLDPDTGELRWVRQLGLRDIRGFNSFFAGGVGVDDGGVYVAASPLVDAETRLRQVRKYDHDGNTVWTHRFPDGNIRCGFSIFNLTAFEGSVYVIGQADDPYVDDCQPPWPGSKVIGLLHKLDADGSVEWQRRIDAGAAPGHHGFTGAKVVWASDAGVFVGANVYPDFPGHTDTGPRSDHGACGDPGDTNFFFPKLDAYVRMYDTDGNVVWTRQFGSGLYEIVAGLGADATSVYAVGMTRCALDQDFELSGSLVDAFIVRMAIDPASPTGKVQLIVGRIETLRDQGRFVPGEFESLAHNLETAIRALDRDNLATARRGLESFAGMVSTLGNRGTLSGPEATALISMVDSVIAAL